MSKTIEMAREAGFDFSGTHLTWEDVICTEEIERFAELVRADEREACAKVCDVFYCDYCADAIRAGGDDMTKDEALRLALDALESADWYIGQLEPFVYPADEANQTHEEHAKVKQAITDLKEALAQTEQPPPWWPAVEKILEEYGLQAVEFVADFKAAMKDASQPPLPEQPNLLGYWLTGTQVVEFSHSDYHDGPEWQPVYTTPPQPAPVQSADVLADEVIGCFEAAESEGLAAALENTADYHLKDLIERRLMYALYAAQKLKEESK